MQLFLTAYADVLFNL